MLKKLTYRIVLIFCCYSVKLVAQSSYQIPLQMQIENSTVIVEGKVKNVQAYWNVEKTMIYTVSTVEVFKVFKGEAEAFIEIITEGGTVGYDAVDVSHALHLNVGAVGLFTLYNENITLNRPHQSSMVSYKVFSEAQGFYVYDFVTNSASNHYYTYQDISRALHKRIIEVTHTVPLEFKTLSALQKAKSSKRNAMAPTGISFSPTTLTAGTKSVLTITGSGFGNALGSVGFKDADDGGATYENALSSEIISWTDTQIKVFVTANAGTGPIRVVTAGGQLAESTEVLTITYSQLNATSDGDAFIIQHYDDNGSGGYTFELTPGLFNDIDHPGARAAFQKALETWSCQTGVNWKVGAQPSQETTRQQSGNVVSFDGGSFGNLSSGSNARTYTSRSGRNCPPNGEQWYVKSIDIIFNKDTNWYFGNGTIQNNQYDFESVALHELGHAHLLDHVIAPGQLMHFRRNSGAESITRSIDANSLEGAKDVYERSTTNQICTTSSAVNLMTGFTGDCTLSLVDKGASGIKVFPNPARQEVFIESSILERLTSVALYDLRGRRVLTEDFKAYSDSNVKRIDVRHITSGVYLMMLRLGDELLSQKLVIQP